MLFMIIAIFTCDYEVLYVIRTETLSFYLSSRFRFQIANFLIQFVRRNWDEVIDRIATFKVTTIQI